MSMRSFLHFVVVAIVCLLSGCIEKQDDGARTVFKFEIWVPVLVILGGVVLLPVAWYIRRKRFLALLLVFLALMVSVGVGVGLFRDRVSLDADRFELVTGFWFAPTRHEVRFENTRGIEIIEEAETRRGNTTILVYLIFHDKQGGFQKILAGDLMKEAQDPILAAARARGVPVLDRRSRPIKPPAA